MTDPIEMMRQQAVPILRELEEIASTLTWKRDTIPAPTGDEAQAFQAHRDQLMVTLARFSLASQGHPGEFGYDGVVVKGGTVVHIPRPLVERLYRIAETTKA